MDNILGLNISFILKGLALLVLFMYIIFTFVIFSQIRAMNKIIFIPASSEALSFVAIVYIALAVSLFLFAAVIL